MGLFNFDNLPVNTLVGADRKTFERATRGKVIDAEYRRKFAVTRSVCRMLDPFYGINERRYEVMKDEMSMQPPVFILGHWRSGTTFMHNVFSCDDSFGCCSTYQTVFPHLMLWGRPFFKRCMSIVMPSERPTDSMKLGVDLPQEEEFALSNMTACSHYHFWMFPRHMAEYRDKYLTFEAAAEDEREEFKRQLDKMIRIALHTSGRRRYLSKNPPHTARVRMLLEMYPDARFIYIVRNPYVVFESTRNFFRKTIASVGLQKISEAELEAQIIENYRALYRCYERDKQLIPQGHLAEVRFEDYEASPLELTEQIYRTVSLGDFDRVRADIRRHLNSIKGFRKKRYEFDRHTIRIVEQNWGDAIRQWGYER